MTDPAMLAIATSVAAAMAGKSAESLSEAAKQAMGALVGRIRQRFQGRPDDEAILRSVVDETDAQEHQEALANALGRLADEDPAFRDQFMDLARKAGFVATVQARSANVINAGTVGKVVSAGGDINIGGDLTL